MSDTICGEYVISPSGVYRPRDLDCMRLRHFRGPAGTVKVTLVDHSGDSREKIALTDNRSGL